MPLDYESLFKAAYNINIKDACAQAHNGKLDTKINNFCEMHGFSREAVIHEICNNPMVAVSFAINPHKQNFYEKTAANFIRNIAGVTNFESLPANGLVVVNGAVMLRADLRRQGGDARTKTIDFRWKYGNVTFYASHKYTKDSGGSQDNQYADLVAFINACQGTTLRESCFVAIADGPYYQKMDSDSRITRINRLKDLAGERQVHACTINEIENLMREFTN